MRILGIFRDALSYRTELFINVSLLAFWSVSTLYLDSGSLYWAKGSLTRTGGLSLDCVGLYLDCVGINLYW